VITITTIFIFIVTTIITTTVHLSPITPL